MANGKAHAAAMEDQDLSDMKKQINDILRLFGALLFFLPILFIGACYGIRAGVIAGTEKTLEMFKSWGG